MNAVAEQLNDLAFDLCVVLCSLFSLDWLANIERYTAA